MTYQLVVLAEAENDILRAEAWYEQQQAGLGASFLRAVRNAMKRLLQRLLLCRLRHKRKQVRWVFIRIDFPFVSYFESEMIP